MPRPPIDRTGRRYGRLTVLRQAERVGAATNLRWMCICDCGRTTAVSGNHLSDGTTRSCGCSRRVSHAGRPVFARREGATSLPRLRVVAAAFAAWLDEHGHVASLILSRAGQWRSAHRVECAMGHGSIVVGTYDRGVTTAQLLEDMVEALKGRP